MDLFIKKPVSLVLAEAGDPNVEHGSEVGLKRRLGALNLTLLGIGAIIGAGIFTLTGHAAAEYAGPGIAYSFVIGGVLCALAGFCYAELAAMLPIAGSAYAYTYTTMGELIAWIIGWDLVLEYAFGAVTVSSAWAGYAYSLVHESLGIILPDWMVRLTKGPWEQVTLPSGVMADGLWNVPASFVALLSAAILYRGVREAAWVNNLIVMVKVTIIVTFIILGFSLISGDLLTANPAASGFEALVPPVQSKLLNGQMTSRFGWGEGGVLTGAGVVFFAYIGFDAVSTAAQETRNPGRDLPIGILCSLAICTVLYVLVALVLTGIVPYRELGVPAPIALGIDRIAELRSWSAGARGTFTSLVKFGALAGLTSVILVLMLGQTRIFYAMARDGLLPWFGEIHPRFHTPHVATVVTGVFVAAAGGAMPLHLVGELVSIGTLLAFLLVCLGVPLLRLTQPDAPRTFRVRLPWLVGTVGALACAYVMQSLPGDTWLRLVVWLIIGFVVYFTYGIHHSHLRGAGRAKTAPGSRP
jgi:basic amino acid/polyamine antiporter, APA family